MTNNEGDKLVGLKSLLKEYGPSALYALALTVGFHAIPAVIGFVAGLNDTSGHSFEWASFHSIITAVGIYAFSFMTMVAYHEHVKNTIKKS